MRGAPTLVASGLGAGGGLFAIDDEVLRLDDMSSTGLAVHPGGQLVARLLYHDADPDEPGELLVYDADGLRAYRRVDDLREPHSAVWHDGRLVVVSTSRNELLWLGDHGEVVRRWSPGGTGDCWHMNNLAVDRGRLLVSAFGRFAQHRGWAQPGARLGTGIVVDVETGTDILGGLTCPHDPLPYGDGWLLCASSAGAVLRLDAAGRTVAEAVVGSWPRGMLVDGDRILVGLSAHRLAADAGAHAAVVELEASTLRTRRRWELECQEVFGLAMVPEPLVQGIRYGRGPRARMTAGHHDAPMPPLPEDACIVEADVHDVPATVPPAAPVEVLYQLRNLGPTTLVSSGATPVHVGVRWVDTSGGTIVEEARDRLRTPLVPGGAAAGRIEIWSPQATGDYQLRVSAVQEHVRWFDDVDPARGWAQAVGVAHPGARRRRPRVGLRGRRR